MAFEQEIIKQLTQELVGGYNLNARLLALLGHPLDCRGKEEAMAMSQELSRVFMVSLFMLKPVENGVEDVRTAPEDGGNGLRTPTKDKRICGEEITPLRKGREEEDTRKEITPSPYKDGYQWRKYGKKTIQNRKFARYYYKCSFSNDRRCKAKKRVQQQDSSSDAPMFQVTYVNKHTCQQQVLSNDNITTSLSTAMTTTTKGHDGAFDPLYHHIGGSVQENEAIITCLATVINGAAAPTTSSSSRPAAAAAVEASRSDPVAYVPAGAGDSPSLEGSMADEMWMAERDSWYDPSFAPVEASESINYHCDVPMDMMSPLARFMDAAPAWPHREYVVWH